MRCPALREAEAAAAAALQRLTHARNELEAEERRARERLAELERQIADLERDIARESGPAPTAPRRSRGSRARARSSPRDGAGAEAANARGAKRA